MDHVSWRAAGAALVLLCLSDACFLHAAPPTTAGEARAALRKKVPLDYEQTPLETILEDFEKRVEITIKVDEGALQAEKVSLAAPVTLHLKDKVPAKGALGLVLKTVGLSYAINKDGSITVRGPLVDEDYVEAIYDLEGLLLTPRSLELPQIADLIVTTIEPNSWSLRGGMGTYSAVENRAALVVRQSPEVHRSISDLLQQLHYLRAAQIYLHVERLDMTAQEWEKLTPLANTLDDEKPSPIRKPADDGEDAAAVDAEPAQPPRRLLAYNGERLRVKTKPKAGERLKLVEGLSLQPVIKADLTGMRIVVEIPADEDGTENGKRQAIDVADGASFFIPLAATAWDADAKAAAADVRPCYRVTVRVCKFPKHVAERMTLLPR